MLLPPRLHVIAMLAVVWYVTECSGGHKNMQANGGYCSKIYNEISR